mmetsp:Transcript_62139/g.147227  ORF Transcript_62139/g.147227 Transcript_62139/m.147227 type:complete len:87 (+) Transcript_62139:37-297(+)
MFQRVELQGWVPGLSSEKRAVVKQLDASAGTAVLQITYAPQGEVTMPRIRDPITGSWTVLGEEEEAEEDIEVHLEELQNVRRILIA